MSRDDLHKLLGGYATGTLTEAERTILFAAALHDQKLFEALADEESLRELLQDSSARAEILAAVAPVAKVRGWHGWTGRPAFWAAAGSLAAAVLIVTLMVPQLRTPHQSQQIALVQELGKSSAPSSSGSAESAAAPERLVVPEGERPASANPPAPRRSANRPEPAQEAAKSFGVIGGVPPGTPVSAPAPMRDSKSSADTRTAEPAPGLGPPAVEGVPAAPVSAVATFRQTAPAATTEAAELRAEKARGELPLRSTQAPQTLARATGLLGTPAIRYELQQRGPTNLYTRIDPDLPLATASPLRLQVETNKAGYLYAFAFGSSGVYTQLSIGPTVDPHVRHTAELGEPEPDRKVMLIFSEHPIAQFAVGSTTEGAIALLERLRKQTSNRLGQRQKSANSVYLSGNAGPAPAVIEIALPAAR